MSAIGTRHYGALLAASVVTLACMALPPPWDVSVSLGFSLVIVLQIRLLKTEGKHRCFSLLFQLIGWLTMIGLWVWLLTPVELRNSGLPLLVLLIVFELQAYPRLVRRLSRALRVTGDVLYGALAGYVLLGLLASLVTALLESIHPGSFRGLIPVPEGGIADATASSIRQIPFIHMAYFAFITLTTLGYGDVLPVTPLAKLSAIVFSALGPIYLAVNMGVLIGRYIQQDQNEM